VAAVDERLAILETQFAALKLQNDHISQQLDTLVASANRARGAWMVVIGLGSAIGAIIAAGAWVFDHMRVP
jgi:hypothetical protein